MSNSNIKPVALAVCTAVGLSLSAGAFASQTLASGYMAAATADHHAGDGKTAEGKCGEGKCGMDKADTDKDGKVSAAEFTAAHPDKTAADFAKIDTNADGFVDKAEHDAHKAAHAGKKGEEGKCGEGKCGSKE